MLARADIERYARHLLLPEIGQAGQARLLASGAALPATADVRAAEVARDYLERAGVTLRDDGASFALPDARAVLALAGRSELVEAAAALAGAFAAVEVIKAAVGAGHAAALPAALCLTKDPQA